jgi:putative nucleotidyltransferase with HDIG domain
LNGIAPQRHTSMMDKVDIIIGDLTAFAAARGEALWLVGGAARDLARGQAAVDLDLAVAGDGFALARAYADARAAAFVPLDAGRATGRVVTRTEPPLTLDIAALRGPSIEEDLRRRDFTVNALALPLVSLEAQGDLQPASFILHPSSLLDPTGGLADLRAGLLRACGPTSMRDDPLRVLRAARLCAGLGLHPEPGLAALLREAAPGLAGVAAERVRDELLRLLDAPAAAPWLRYLDACGALTVLFPELEPARACAQPRIHFLPVLAHSLEAVAALDWLILSIERSAQRAGPPAPVLEELPIAVRSHPTLGVELPYTAELAALLGERRAGGHRRAALLKLAALLHDNAKPQTKAHNPDGSVSFHGHQTLGAEVAEQICRRLRLSRQDGSYVALVVREHMRPGQLRAAEVLTARAVARLFRDLGGAAPDVLLHELADHMATRGPHLSPEGWAAHLAWVGDLLSIAYAPAPERRTPLVNGHDLIAGLGLTPGPLVGMLLREIAEAQAAGEISTRAEALALAHAKLRRPGRTEH